MSSWELKAVQALLHQYYPKGQVWEAIVPEGVFDIGLNDTPGCHQEVEGIAIDLDGDHKPDLFQYDRTFSDHVVATWPNLDSYLETSASLNSPYQETPVCEGKPQGFKPVGFPFAGRTLPNSEGKITSIMFATNGITNGPVGELLKNRPDLKCQILYLEEDWLRQFFAPTCRETSFFSYTNRECDLPPCGGGMWVANEVYVGTNDESGAPFASADSERGMKLYVNPLVKTLGALPLQIAEDEDPANLLASSKYLFVAAFLREFKPEDLNVQRFASGREIVNIDMMHVPSAAHLDMILTPTEEIMEGKPVVFLAQGVPSDAGGEEKGALDEIAKKLEARGFYVDRIPYVYTGYDHHVMFDSPEAFSYNNCLMERYQENGNWIKKVYLPWYTNYETYNNQAAAVYKKYGYEVIPIHGLEHAGELGGALQCMVKVTGREQVK